MTEARICLIQGRRGFRRCRSGPLPPSVMPMPMPNGTDQPPAMREGDCPFCERTVLVYQEPPRCPLCDCPLEEFGMRPFSFPGDAERD